MSILDFPLVSLQLFPLLTGEVPLEVFGAFRQFLSLSFGVEVIPKPLPIPAVRSSESGWRFGTKR